MQLISQIINKKLKISNDFFIKKFYAKAIWNFYQAFCWSLAVLEIDLSEDEIYERNILFKKIFLNESNINQITFKKIKKLVNKDTKIVLQAIKFLENVTEEEAVNVSGYGDHPDYIGRLNYETEGLD